MWMHVPVGTEQPKSGWLTAWMYSFEVAHWIKSQSAMANLLEQPSPSPEPVAPTGLPAFETERMQRLLRGGKQRLSHRSTGHTPSKRCGEDLVEPGGP
jgi:hypothetical protein